MNNHPTTVINRVIAAQRGIPAEAVGRAGQGQG